MAAASSNTGKPQGDMDGRIRDLASDRPLCFSIGEERYKVYHPTLGKLHRLDQTLRSLDVNDELLRVNPCAEALRLCGAKRDAVARILAIHTLNTKQELDDEWLVAERSQMIAANLDREEMAQLLLHVLTIDDIAAYSAHLGLDEDKALRERIAAVKSDGGKTVSTGGRSIFGTIYARAAKELHLTQPQAEWEVPYATLMLMLADAPSSVYLSDDERKALGTAAMPPSNVLLADDPANWKEIMSMRFA